jgi:hypothetical protein
VTRQSWFDRNHGGGSLLVNCSRAFFGAQ